MKKLRKGDDVIIIAGKDKGKRGTIISVKDEEHVVVQGINSVKKHQKPNPTSGSVGGILSREMPIHISNVAIYNFTLQKADRIGFRLDADNNKTRIFRSNGQLIES